MGLREKAVVVGRDVGVIRAPHWDGSSRDGVHVYSLSREEREFVMRHCGVWHYEWLARGGVEAALVAYDARASGASGPAP